MAVFSTVSRRREHCHSADALSLSLLIHLLKAEGSAAEWQNSRRRRRPGSARYGEAVTAALMASLNVSTLAELREVDFRKVGYDSYMTQVMTLIHDSYMTHT